MFEHDEKIKTYQSALDKVIKELRAKRTELAALAKKTVADIEASIPGLQKKVNDLRAESQKLDADILQKQEKYSKEKTSFLAEFENMKAILENAHNVKIGELSRAKVDADKAKQEYQANAKFLEDKSKELSASLEASASERAANQKAADAFKAEKEQSLKELSIEKSKVAEKDSQNQALGEQLKAEIAKTQEKTKLLVGKIAEAEAIISRINEANLILAKAQTIEDASKKREEKNNTDAVNNLAEKKRLALRSDEQDRRDEALKAREDNIKVLEKKISQ